MRIPLTRPRRLAQSLTLAMVVADAGVSGADLKPESIDAWQRYVAATEQRRAGEQQRGPGFLVLDFGSAPATERKAVLAGDVVVRRMKTTGPAGKDIEIPSALVHHWRGAVFLPGMTVERLMTRLEEEPPSQRDVLRKGVLSRGPDRMLVYLRLRRTKIVTVVYDTEHTVRFERFGPTRAASTTVATKIVELSDPGTPRERGLPEGRDRGFLWRLNAYWRYEQVEGGVIAECESVSLSRGVPFGLKTITGPIISSAARESMEAALLALRGL